MIGLQSLGSMISDPYADSDDAPLWNSLLESAAYHEPKLYVKLIGLRYAGAELKPDSRFGYRLEMANNATVTQDDMRELLLPHTKLLINLILHLGGKTHG